MSQKSTVTTFRTVRGRGAPSANSAPQPLQNWASPGFPRPHSLHLTTVRVYASIVESVARLRPRGVASGERALVGVARR